MACAGFPYLGSLTDGPWMAFEPMVRVRKVFGAHCSWPDPLTIVFPFSHTETNFEIMKPIFVAPQFTKPFNLIDRKIRNNFPFGSKFKFQTKFELKFLEVKLLLNLN
jgi:hypothetical protein